MLGKDPCDSAFLALCGRRCGRSLAGPRARCQEARPSASEDARAPPACAHAHSCSSSHRPHGCSPIVLRHLLPASVSLRGPKANTARSEQADPPAGARPERLRFGKAKPNPLTSLSHPYEDLSEVWARDPGGAQGAGSSPGAKAVRHPPCEAEKKERVTLPSPPPQRAQAAHRALGSYLRS